MLYSILFKSDYLLFSKKSVPLQCVFHSIRFKVNKGWSKALLLFYFIPLTFTIKQVFLLKMCISDRYHPFHQIIYVLKTTCLFSVSINGYIFI